MLAYLNDPSVQTALHVDGSYTTPMIVNADDDLRIPGDDVVDTDKNNRVIININSQEEQQHYHSVLNHQEVMLADGRVSNTDADAHQWDVCNDEVNQHWAFNDYLSDTTSLYSTIYTHKNKPSNSAAVADDDDDYNYNVMMMIMMMIIMIIRIIVARILMMMIVRILMMMMVMMMIQHY